MKILNQFKKYFEYFLKIHMHIQNFYELIKFVIMSSIFVTARIDNCFGPYIG